MPSHFPSEGETANYFTGLRGLAALVVYNSHLGYLFIDITKSFSSWDESSWLELPVIRIFYAGGSAVAVFFVLSGFVLSMKPLALARQGDHGTLLQSLSSSIFRRTWRLVLPCLPSTLLVMLAAYFALFDPRVEESGRWAAAPPRQGNIFLQVWDWLFFVFWGLLDFWSFKAPVLDSNYGPHLWTIPFELRNSMILYVCIIGLTGLQDLAFVIFAVVFLLFCYFQRVWDVSLFIGGLTIAKSTESMRSARIHSWLRTISTAALTLFGIYLASLPPDPLGRFGLAGNALTMVSGPLLILAGVAHSAHMQKLLAMRPLVFFGDISFSFYIIHEPMLRLLGCRVASWASDRAHGSQAVGIGTAWLTLTPLLVILSTLYWKCVEQPCIRSAKRLHTGLCSRSKETVFKNQGYEVVNSIV